MTTGTTDSDPGRRRGPRPRHQDTREAILAAARTEFATRGYEGATLRGIARAAGVDARLVHHYFDGKSEVFKEALALPVSLRAAFADVAQGDPHGLGERILSRFFAVWDAPEGRERLLALVAGVVGSAEVGAMFRQFLHAELHTQIVGLLSRVGAGADDPELRASLMESQLIGVIMARYVVGIEPLASAEPEDLIPFLAPTLQRYFLGPIP